MTLPLLTTVLIDSAAAPVMRAQPAWLWTLEAVIAVSLALLMAALLAAYLVLAWKLRSAFEKLANAVERFRADVRPVTERAAAIADHLEVAAASVRGAVEDVTDTIHGANETLRDAVATADERFRELDAIVQVARDEAEDLVVGSASALRGVRGGLSAFGRRRRRAEADADGAEDEAPDEPPRREGGPRVRRPVAQDE
ncbi:MAG TPA: hypothetical protein VMT93_08280 [Gemmatimonadaceae bacterium]|nr:hypothetical protein [Gemmatimonadaceae bacterium]